MRICVCEKIDISTLSNAIISTSLIGPVVIFIDFIPVTRTFLYAQFNAIDEFFHV